MAETVRTPALKLKSFPGEAFNFGSYLIEKGMNRSCMLPGGT
jgi:hypothetical protein